MQKFKSKIKELERIFRPLQERRISAHEQLYQDATRRLQRQAQYEGSLPEDYTFAPRILRRAPESCKVLRGHRNTPGRRDSDADLAERCGSRPNLSYLLPTSIENVPQRVPASNHIVVVE